ncbi:MAG: hypothetical protein JSV88_12630 [Candidatus Aminicenantes bacterium]|nr:MAG: hypothetical protein JSV88_12630 [Candidatus Aminicenantes bacterium]
MKRYMIAMVFICELMFVFVPGCVGLFAQDAEKDPVAAESIEQLQSLIEKALKENDFQKLEEIKKSKLELVRGNLFLTAQKCNILLDEKNKKGARHECH